MFRFKRTVMNVKYFKFSIEAIHVSYKKNCNECKTFLIKVTTAPTGGQYQVFLSWLPSTFALEKKSVWSQVITGKQINRIFVWKFIMRFQIIFYLISTKIG